MTAAEVKAALARRHDSTNGTGQWVCLEEAFGIDLLAIGAWASAKAPGLPGAGRREGAQHPVVAYEVKVSRGDYHREVNGYEPGPGASYRTRGVPPWPAKAYFALERSHYFLFAVPRGMLTYAEVEQRFKPSDPRALWLPPEVGLIEVDAQGCHVRAPAVRRPARPLTVAETAALLRHGIDPNAVRKVREENAYLRNRVASLEAQLADGH